MEGEEGDSDDPRSFGKAAWWKRLIILVAGSAMNFLIGAVLMVIVYLPVQQVVSPVIESFEPYATVDDGAGLQVGDRILEVDGEKIYVYSDVSMILGLNPGDIHDLVVERQGQQVVLEDFHLERHEVLQEDGTTKQMFGMNFTLETLSLEEKLQYSWTQCLNTVRIVRLSLQMLLTGKAGIADMTGPIGIVQQMSSVASSSDTAVKALLNLLYFGGFIAINLGAMNLLPFPALDGGRIVGVLLITPIEAITKKKVDPRIEGYLHGAGMILLLGLMAVIMFKDIIWLFK